MIPRTPNTLKMLLPTMLPKAMATCFFHAAIAQVTNSGKVQVDAGTTLLQFLAESGGFTRFAATNRIQLRRATKKGEKVLVFNFRAVEAGASVPKRTVLRDGDVIVVPQRKLFE